MVVDEERKFPMTKYCTRNGQKSVKISDHNLLIIKLCVRWKSLNDVDNRQEIYNFQNVESFQRFEMLTESDDDLKNCFVDRILTNLQISG